MANRNFETAAIHSSKEHSQHGGFNVPIMANSTFAQTTAGEWDQYTYTRTNNPTEQALREALAELEQGTAAICFSSGLAAIAATFDLLEAGDRIIAMSDIYGGTYRLLEQFAQRRGIEVIFADLSDLEVVNKLPLAGVKMFYCETPSNPSLRVSDLVSLSSVAKSAGALLVVDNTLATPFFQRPLCLGADIVVQSTSKYISGHTNVVGGAIVVRDETLAERLHFIRKATGAVPGPFDCYLVMLGLKTLALRMERHQQNASQVAKHLLAHRGVEVVKFLGLPTHPQAELIKKQMFGYSGIVTIELESQGAAIRFVNSLDLFSTAVSFGSVASLVDYPAVMSHKDVSGDDAQDLALVRLSVGTENIADIIKDIDAALALT